MAYGLSNYIEAAGSIFLGLDGNIETSAFNPIRDTLFCGNQMVYDITGSILTTTSTLVVPVGGALKAGTSITRALAVHFGKTALSTGVTYGVNKVGEHYGWSESERFWAGVGAGVVTGIATQTVDKHYNLSGYYSSVRPPRSGVKISDEGRSKTNKFTSEEAEEFAFKSTKGKAKADSVALGKYADGGPNSYTKVAESMDAQYFDLDNWDELASQYSADEIWKVNEKFLDIQTSSGRDIYLSHNPADYIGDGSFFSKELQYLLDSGYTFIKEGDVWRATR
ncbi:MAG TPA: hypothetical protein DC024_07795 [Clostridiales bacterium]|nr:hypothetical protein [Clostridiales bacterium]